MLVLAIDAATYTGSVALIADGKVRDETVVAMRGQHEERLMPAVVGLLERQAVTVGELNAVACGAGPGNFTPLRIAASIAKGLAFARSIPLLAAPSTLLILAGAEPFPAPGKYVTAIDAMRGDWFCHEAASDSSGRIEPGRAWRATRAELESHARSSGARIMGPAEPEPVPVLARGFARLLALGLAPAVDVASWEPDYGRKAEAQVRWEAAHGRDLADAR